MSDEEKIEGIQGLMVPEEAHISEENEIMSMVCDMCPEIDLKILSEWLSTRNWDMINGPEWSHLRTNEKKAKILSGHAKVDLRPPVQRAHPKE